MQDEQNQELVYSGGEETLEYIEKVIAEQGPFDGLWAFSQVGLSN